MKKINNPHIGTIVYHKGWKKEEDKNYPCDVYITGGVQFGTDGLSNYWTWRRVLSDGSLSDEEESGYGDFEESKYKYEVEVKVKRIEVKEEY